MGGKGGNTGGEGGWGETRENGGKMTKNEGGCGGECDANGKKGGKVGPGRSGCSTRCTIRIFAGYTPALQQPSPL